jgi:acylphosphatase
MRVARRYLVSGRVQGVGFRYFAQDVANREGLTGYVRNLPNGSVEVTAEGDDESLRRFEAALWRGPSHARVENVEVEATAPTGHHSGFIVGH